MKQEFSILPLAARIATEADAYKLMEELVWPGGQPAACPQCGTAGKFYFLAPKDGGGTRKTRTGADTARRLWKCATCRKKFSVLTGTVFHGSKIPLRTWLFVMFEVASSKNGVSAREIKRKYELTPKTAWFMLHRIREAMKRGPSAGLLSGTLAADETWIGGNPANQHARKRLAAGADRWATQKTTALSVIDKASGEARSAVVHNVRASTLRKAMERELEINLGASILHTDSAAHLHHHRSDHQRPRVRQPQRRRVRTRPDQLEHGRRVLLPPQALHRRDTSPRQQGTPAPLPRTLRLHVLHPQADRLRADAATAGPGQRTATDLPAPR